jgi:hypothetical protein
MAVLGQYFALAIHGDPPLGESVTALDGKTVRHRAGEESHTGTVKGASAADADFVWVRWHCLGDEHWGLHRIEDLEEASHGTE